MINLGELGPSILRSIFSPQEAGAESRFSKGEIVQGRVIKTLGGDGALVRMRGMTMLASTQTRLDAGQSILVKVEQVKPQFVVSLLLNDTPMQEKTAALLRLYLPSAMPISGVLAELETLLASLEPSALKGSGLGLVMAELEKTFARYAGDAKNVFELLGFFHESELSRKKPSQNLKRSLLVIRKNLEAMAEKEPFKYRETLNRVAKALQNIELRQLVNLVERQEVKSWQIPYWNGENLSSARLYVRREPAGKIRTVSESVTRITLILEMSRLGPMRIDLSAREKKMEGQFYLSNDIAVKEVEERLPELVEALSRTGFNAGFSVKKAADEFLTEELTDDAALPVNRLFNVKV